MLLEKLESGVAKWLRNQDARGRRANQAKLTGGVVGGTIDHVWLSQRDSTYRVGVRALFVREGNIRPAHGAGRLPPPGHAVQLSNGSVEDSMTVDREELAAVSDPRRSALVVVDMQNDFCNPADYPESVPMLPRLQRLINESRRAGVQVIFTQVNHDATNDSTVWVSRRAPGRKDIVKAGTSGAEYHPDFQPQPGDIDIVKHRYSAFIGTPLEMNLRTLGIET